MGDGSIDLTPFFVEVVPVQVPVKNGFEQLWLAPEHRPGWEAELTVALDVVEIEAFEKRIGFGVVSVLMAPAGIMFNSETESVILNGIDNSCLW